jgi:N-acylneuraminate cytidylyltransferase/CMP-N,N'-diacetyllegionaminic acid synthase
MTRIAILCARGGSKGVPGKNIRPLAGRPLIVWSIVQARETGLFDLIAVSSDDAAILDAAGDAGAGLLVRRPDALATDTVSVLPAILHCLQAAEAHLRRQACSITYLQATSPTRDAADIAACLDLFEAHRPGSVVTGSPAKSSPYFSLLEERSEGTVGLSKPTDPPVVRRQDAPRCFDMNGSVYVFDRDRFMADPRVLYPDTRLHEMPGERSVDIDTELDWALAELVFSRR